MVSGHWLQKRGYGKSAKVVNDTAFMSNSRRIYYQRDSSIIRSFCNNWSMSWIVNGDFTAVVTIYWSIS